MSENQSKIDPANPKDLIGAKKVPMGQVPPVAIAHEAAAMLDGTLKYGYRNYRDKKVRATVYIDAALRHLYAWLEGEEVASDSGVHHLGHARACLGILLDAQAHDTLLDDRVKGDFPKINEQLAAWTKTRVEKDATSKG
jgi:Domain of unknown function (DUF5664)